MTTTKKETIFRVRAILFDSRSIADQLVGTVKRFIVLSDCMVPLSEVTINDLKLDEYCSIVGYKADGEKVRVTA